MNFFNAALSGIGGFFADAARSVMPATNPDAEPVTITPKISEARTSTGSFAEDAAGFLSSATSLVKNLGMGVSGFLNAGASTVADTRKSWEKFQDSMTMPKAEAGASAGAWLTENKESLLMIGAVGIIGFAVIYSAVK